MANKLATSGATKLETKGAKQTGKVTKADVSAAAGLTFFFGRTVPDCSPGWNTLTLTLPAGTRVISVWMTEWANGNVSHAGAAWFTTSSVQLFANGTRCRVQYHSSWGTNLPAGYQVILGS
jgi:hypothetical protein